jgi:hypothetical protein
MTDLVKRLRAYGPTSEAWEAATAIEHLDRKLAWERDSHAHTKRLYNDVLASRPKRNDL